MFKKPPYWRQASAHDTGGSHPSSRKETFSAVEITSMIQSCIIGAECLLPNTHASQKNGNDAEYGGYYIYGVFHSNHGMISARSIRAQDSGRLGAVTEQLLKSDCAVAKAHSLVLRAVERKIEVKWDRRAHRGHDQAAEGYHHRSTYLTQLKCRINP